MSLRARLALLAALAVALAIALASGVVYVLVRDQLRGQIDDALRERVQAVDVLGRPGRLGLDFRTERLLGGAGGYVQLVPAEGPPLRLPGAEVELPVERARGVAAGTRGDFYEDATVAGTHIRLLSVRVAPGVAVQIARPLTEIDRTLSRLALLLTLVCAGGIGLAGGAGLLVARTALAPVRRLTDAAEHVTRTGDLTRRIDDGRPDELGRLARSFDAMLEALEDSVTAQRRLVTDASHELRTPLTSLRTNLEVLSKKNGLRAPERRRLLEDVLGQLEELTGLVGDVVELARGEDPDGDADDVRLDLVVADAVDRARRHAPHVGFETKLEPTVVRGVARRLDRAVANLLDNAAKWSPEGATVDVALEDGELSVRDRGPGIDEADIPHVFDRFYRARAARQLPGSGLGLAIVRSVAETHGGSVSAANEPEGGTVLRLKLTPQD